jgi:hypothetical protein
LLCIFCLIITCLINLRRGLVEWSWYRWHLRWLYGCVNLFSFVERNIRLSQWKHSLGFLLHWLCFLWDHYWYRLVLWYHH